MDDERFRIEGKVAGIEWHLNGDVHIDDECKDYLEDEVRQHIGDCIKEGYNTGELIENYYHSATDEDVVYSGWWN